MNAERLADITGADFFTGVPDSQLKSLCNYLMDSYGLDPCHHIIAANEGNAVALAAGYHLATGKVPVVYMQNSGEGNIINPLASLLNERVYAIPMIFVLGWRGEPGVHDEPQHVKQGKITCSLLDTMGIPYSVLPEDEEGCRNVLKECSEHLCRNNSAYAIVVRKNTFSDYTPAKKTSLIHNRSVHRQPGNNFPSFKRETLCYAFQQLGADSFCFGQGDKAILRFRNPSDHIRLRKGFLLHFFRAGIAL